MALESTFRHARNPLTMFGGWLTTVSAILFLAVFFADLFGLQTNPYMGIVFFLVLPGFFVAGPGADAARHRPLAPARAPGAGGARRHVARHRPQHALHPADRRR